MSKKYVLVQYDHDKHELSKEIHVFPEEMEARDALDDKIGTDPSKTYMVIDFDDDGRFNEFVDNRPTGDEVQIMHKVRPLLTHWGNTAANRNVFRRQGD